MAIRGSSIDPISCMKKQQHILEIDMRLRFLIPALAVSALTSLPAMAQVDVRMGG